MSYVDPEGFQPTHFGVCTGWGAEGEWLIEGDFFEIHDLFLGLFVKIIVNTNMHLGIGSYNFMSIHSTNYFSKNYTIYFFKYFQQYL